jgi:hypothetical protein
MIPIPIMTLIFLAESVRKDFQVYGININPMAAKHMRQNTNDKEEILINLPSIAVNPHRKTAICI